MKRNIQEDRRYLIERLGYFRARAKLSARELSQRLGFSIAYIAKFESGDFSIPAEVLLDAITICGTTPEEFFAEDYQNYVLNKDLSKKISQLSEDNKSRIIGLIESLH